jgi:hypothetical protein
MAKVKGKQSIDEAHCLKRLKERFEVGMNHDEYRRLVNCLKSPGAKIYDDIQYKFIGRESNTRSLYKMSYKGIEFHAIYNRSSKSIITVLFTPEEVNRLGLVFGGTDETEQEE